MNLSIHEELSKIPLQSMGVLRSCSDLNALRHLSCPNVPVIYSWSGMTIKSGRWSPGIVLATCTKATQKSENQQSQEIQ